MIRSLLLSLLAGLFFLSLVHEGHAASNDSQSKNHKSHQFNLENENYVFCIPPPLDFDPDGTGDWSDVITLCLLSFGGLDNTEICFSIIAYAPGQGINPFER